MDWIINYSNSTTPEAAWSANSSAGRELIHAEAREFLAETKDLIDTDGIKDVMSQKAYAEMVESFGRFSRWYVKFLACCKKA